MVKPKQVKGAKLVRAMGLGIDIWHDSNGYYWVEPSQRIRGLYFETLNEALNDLLGAEIGLTAS